MKLKFRPFDKEFIMVDYYQDLDDDSKEWLIKFNQEEINGNYFKENSIYTPKVCRAYYKKIQKDPELLRQFNLKLQEENKKRKKKKEKLFSPHEFIKRLWQREANRKVWERRDDAFATFFRSCDRFIDNNKGLKSKKGLGRKRIIELIDAEKVEDHSQDPQELEWTNAKESQKLPEDIQDFLDCRKADRVDLYIWHKLIDVCSSEKEKKQYFKDLEKELVKLYAMRSQGKINKTNYYLMLKGYLDIADLFAKNPDSKKTCNELENIFNLVVYPYKQGKLQKEK